MYYNRGLMTSTLKHKMRHDYQQLLYLLKRGQELKQALAGAGDGTPNLPSVEHVKDLAERSAYSAFDIFFKKHVKRPRRKVGSLLRLGGGGGALTDDCMGGMKASIRRSQSWPSQGQVAHL
jgi:hypothetical protein